jgi:SNF2 family DNA or RNA helicase
MTVLTPRHVVLTTYDMITGSDFTVFRNIPRWEMLIVDEGQRRKLSGTLYQADQAVKSDSSLMFNRLKSLNSVHRILLTGTPLNNNLRELFNLLNFLDPANFKYVVPLFLERETYILVNSQISKDDLQILTRPSWVNCTT